MTTPEDAALPTFDAAQLAAIAPFGEERTVAVGEVLYSADDSSGDLSCTRPSFFVILEGEAEVVRPDAAGDVLIAVQGPGRFLGELNLLTGQRPYLTARMRHAGRVLELPPQEFHRLMSSTTDLANIIFTALTARREQLRHGEAARGLSIVGSRYSPEAMALRGFVTRSQVPHTWFDVDEVADPDALLARLGLHQADLPAVKTSTTVLRRTTPGELGEHLGLTFRSAPGYLFDLVVVGSGPAGLAAAVCGASEGLTTVSVDGVAIGGQAGGSRPTLASSCAQGPRYGRWPASRASARWRSSTRRPAGGGRSRAPACSASSVPSRRRPGSTTRWRSTRTGSCSPIASSRNRRLSRPSPAVTLSRSRRR